MRARLPTTVWALGIVSLLTDVSSELVHALLPLLLAGPLGASMVMIGLIEGMAEATASIVKLFSGALSDRIGRRKPLVVAGYGLSALTKLVFPLVNSAGFILGARLLDRIGKGIRGAPRDALIADVTPPEQRGAAYGLRQSLDTVGAVIGPLAAMALMLWLLDVRAALWFAAIPGLLAVLVLMVYVREPEQHASDKKTALTLRDWRVLDARVWGVIGIAAMLNLARFGEGFLVIRMRDAGFGNSLAPMALVLMSLAFTLTAYPVGWWADRIPRRSLLLTGVVLLVVADLVFAGVPGRLGAALGVVLWGVHLGFTQGLLSAMLSDVAPKALRGTAFGVFHLAGGIALLVASVAAGGLWQWLGAQAMFLVAAVVALAALIGASRASALRADR
ncbi:MAG: MFS transporter [Rhodanobacteraceae bacterium]|nr:MFS transporter [Rhodanobacteraceae bacterium]MBL0040493.1 MFS transporter [Xanthomonadales bacterium]MBP6079137.1 MFS transporter [Xanthomonadales bacterium]MBP7622817.1 MFS transporter [Xanthomonadales bacterium]